MIELPITSLGTLNKFFTDNGDIVLKYVVLKISEHTEQEHVDLFAFEQSEFVAKIYQKDYLGILDKAISIFVKLEQFEDAALCRDLITRISVDTVIRES